MAVYLEMTHFNDERYYQIHVEDDAFTEDKIYGPRNAGGVTVYSECCADTMSLDVVRKVHAALGEYLAAHDA